MVAKRFVAACLRRELAWDLDAFDSNFPQYRLQYDSERPGVPIPEVFRLLTEGLDRAQRGTEFLCGERTQKRVRLKLEHTLLLVAELGRLVWLGVKVDEHRNK